MENDGACKIGRQNKKTSCAGKSQRRKNNAGTDKEMEKKLAGPLAKKELPAGRCPRRNGKREEGSWQKKSDEDTKRKAEMRVEWRMLNLQ